MSEADVRKKLEAMGRWSGGHTLEPFEWLVMMAPPGALDGVEAYRLIDGDYRPARDTQGRDWTPVLDVGDQVLVDASPELLDALLRQTGYFDQPEAFGNLVLLQFHRFALYYYDGYQVREQSFDYVDGKLTIRGDAFRGAGRNARETAFETVASRDEPARFRPDATAAE